MPRDPAATLLDIRDAARSAVDFARGMSRETFMADRRTQKAIIYDIQTVGEAVKRLPDAFRLEHPKIPWALAAGMRDKLVHDYDQVNLDRVWQVAIHDLPKLLEQLEPLMPQPEE